MGQRFGQTNRQTDGQTNQHCHNQQGKNDDGLLTHLSLWGKWMKWHSEIICHSVTKVSPGTALRRLGSTPLSKWWLKLKLLKCRDRLQKRRIFTSRIISLVAACSTNAFLSGKPCSSKFNYSHINIFMCGKWAVKGGSKQAQAAAGRDGQGLVYLWGTEGTDSRYCWRCPVIFSMQWTSERPKERLCLLITLCMSVLSCLHPSVWLWCLLPAFFHHTQT